MYAEADSTLAIDLPEPHEGQQRVINEAKRFNVLQCGRRFGKTTLGMDRLIEPGLAGQPAAWFAPTYKMLSEVWREVKAVLAPLAPTISEQERRIGLVTGGVLDFWSLDQPDAGRGRKYKRVVIDEAGLIRNLDAAWNESIRPTLADLIGDAWFLGTPHGRGYFHRLFTRGQEPDEPEWKSWRMPTVTNPVIKASEVEAARRGMLPSAFNQEFLGIPADDGGCPFGLPSIEACAVRGLSAGPATSYGIDLAKSEDWTVICGLNASGDVCELHRWQSDWGQTRRRIVDLIGSTIALVDSTGVGDPIVEDLQRQPKTHVIGYPFTSKSKQQIMEGLSAAIQRGEVHFPGKDQDEPEHWLRDELESFQYEYRENGVRYSAPDGMHDDGVCGLALAVHCRATHRPVEIESEFFMASAG